MKYLLATLILASCAAPGGQGPDLAGLADQIEVVRQTVLTASSSATDTTRVRVEKLSEATLEVERKLIAASEGGPIDGPTQAAEAALAIADDLLREIRDSGQDVGDLPFYVALARAALLELSGGHVGAAQRAIDSAGR